MPATTQTNGNSDDKTVALDSEAKQLKLQQTKAESRKAIAEAEKGRLAAMLPTADVKTDGGKIDVRANVGLVAALPALIALAPSVVAGVASIASYFKSDYAVSSRDVKVGLPPLMACVVHHLMTITPEVRVTVDRFRLLGASSVLDRYNAAATLR